METDFVRGKLSEQTEFKTMSECNLRTEDFGQELGSTTTFELSEFTLRVQSGLKFEIDTHTGLYSKHSDVEFEFE